MILFPDFLTDPDEYTAAEQFWQAIWQDLNPSEHWVTPWLNTSFLNGQPFLDGNPIFSAYSPNVQRAVRIVQLEPDDEGEMTWWLDKTVDSCDRPLTRLTIACVLSEKNAAKSRDLLQQWIQFTGDHTRFVVVWQ